MLQKIYDFFAGDHNEKYIKTLEPLVEQINKQEEEYQQLSETEFLKNTQKFKDRIANGETTDDILVEAFATVKNACRRLTEKKHSFTVGNKEMTWEMIPYDVQMLGGIILHRGNISEMKTGEGKTLVSVAPLYLNALEGKGAHLVTANEYLAERDALWMAQAFEYLGLTVGVTKHGQSHEEKKAAYNCDITYGTNNEFGFDYLRNNMAVREENLVMRDLHFAIVDEVDSILIDEARTPLIISAPREEATEKYKEYQTKVRHLERDTHYILDEKERTVTLNEEGIQKMEQLLGIDNIYTDGGFETVHHIESALKAQAVFEKDKDYVVQNGQVVIVDEFTGRLMAGRRFSGGLHQALEAKEGVEIKRESRTLASITFQNYFRMYNKLAGMTGTALTEAKEFGEIYGLDTYAVPTHRPIMRNDKSDAVFKNMKGKYMAITKRVKEAYDKGQPVLIGTISIEKSEVLSSLLQQAGVPHTVLNAKHHEKEAEIIENAGQKGAVTIATNMAGRGTDIKPSKEAYEAGGLLVIGTERHESRRIDNQLRGRSGRQGDPGETQFFVCMDDDLMRLFGGEKMKNMMQTMQIPDDMPIENGIISNAIESAQKKVEQRNFEVRKHVLQYDDVMNVHRERMYGIREKILKEEDVKEDIVNLIKKHVRDTVDAHTQGIKPAYWDYNELKKSLETFGLQMHEAEKLEDEGERDPQVLKEFIVNFFISAYDKKEASLPNPELMRQVEKAAYLQNIDKLWMQHIDEMTRLREMVVLQAYANKNPLHEYKHQAFEAFKLLQKNVANNTIRELFTAKVELKPIQVQRIAPDESKMQTNEKQIESQLNTSHILPKAVQGNGVTNVVQADNSPIQADKVGRNDPCPCGSGKKYKKCHGA